MGRPALSVSEAEEAFWQEMAEHQEKTWHTARGLAFSYVIRGNEMFISRKDKSITRATAVMAWRKALELQETLGFVKGPKMLGTFGASYLYPIFLALGICSANKQEKK